MKRYLTYAILPLIGLFVSVIAYRMWQQSEARREAQQCEISFSRVPFNPNVGTRCLPNTVYLSRKRQYPEPSEVVDARCADLQQRLEQAVTNGSLELARTAIAEGANPNSPGDDYNLNRSLILATGMDRKDMVRLLLDNGADVNDRQCCCMECRTPLLVAVERGDECLVRMLIARGADACYDIPYTEGETIGSFAELRGNKEIAALVNQACATAWERDPQPEREIALLYSRMKAGRKF